MEINLDLNENASFVVPSTRIYYPDLLYLEVYMRSQV
jgi:hypothetical protein